MKAIIGRFVVLASEIEHRIRPGLEAQAVRFRKGSDLPTVMVGPGGSEACSPIPGDSDYRERQISVRDVWGGEAQFFISHVRAASRVESNDCGSMFTNLQASRSAVTCRSAGSTARRPSLGWCGNRI